eukprot:scaffold20167_cov15-Tisochrysis_lutea.AAC.1
MSSWAPTTGLQAHTESIFWENGLIFCTSAFTPAVACTNVHGAHVYPLETMHSDPRVHLLIPSSVPIESQLSEREPRIMVVYFLFWDYKTSGGWILERKGK